MALAGIYTYEGDGVVVTTIVVTSADPLGSVVVEREVTIVGDGVVMVRIVVGAGLGVEGERGVVVVVVEVLWPPSSVQEPNSV